MPPVTELAAITVTYFTEEGERGLLEVACGESLMEAATRNLIPGILGDCGGCAACGTCYVRIAPEWRQRIEPPSESETLMLEAASEPSLGLRLSCQIRATAGLQGLEFTVAPQN